jgi:hypothetical protein
MVRENGNGKYISVKNQHIHLSQIVPYTEITDSVEWRDLIGEYGTQKYHVSIDKKVRNATTKRELTISKSGNDGQCLVTVGGKMWDLDQLYERPFPEKAGLEWLDEICRKYSHIKREKVLDIIPLRRKTLIIYAHPELLDELYLESGDDVSLVTIWDRVTRRWICQTHVFYTASVAHRLVRGDGCRECTTEKIRAIDKETLDRHREEFNARENPDTTGIGDRAEEYVVEMLRRGGCQAEKVGHLSNPDIDVVTDIGDGHWRAVQVKTLAKDKPANGYYITSRQNYKPNVLMILVSTDRQRFALRFTHKLAQRCFTFGLAGNVDMFCDEGECMGRVAEMLRSTLIVTDIRDHLTGTQLIEYDSLERLATLCTAYDHIFTRNTTNSTTVDGFIDDTPIQCKYRNLSQGSSVVFRITCHKSCGTIDGRRISQPYSITDDFEYLVVELGGTLSEPEKYQGQFCIIPKDILVQEGILKTDTQPGRMAITICPPDYTKPHWSKTYWFSQM